MKTNKIWKEAYADLKAAAIADTATQIDIDTLGEWFFAYGNDFWNGEYYNADDFKITPIYKQIDEDNFKISHYEIDSL